MPGTAAGTTLRKHAIVASATCAGVACPPENFLPGITMFGFSSMPASSTRCAMSSLNTVCNVSVVTREHSSIE